MTLWEQAKMSDSIAAELFRGCIVLANLGLLAVLASVALSSARRAPAAAKIVIRPRWR